MFKDLGKNNSNSTNKGTDKMSVMIRSLPKKKICLPKVSGDHMWTEINNHSGWRLQENVLTHHCRLINPENAIFAWGQKNKMNELLNKAIAN